MHLTESSKVISEHKAIFNLLNIDPFVGERVGIKEYVNLKRDNGGEV